MKDTLPDRVRIGVFELDLRAGELREGERTTLLQQQPFRILVMLMERAGEIVTREEIQKKLWPNDTVVEFDHSINSAIKKLRSALRDSADEPRYIETLARRGYRLMVPVVVEPRRVPPITPANIEVTLVDDATAQAAPAETAASLIGKKVSHYRVLEVIGGGGMGLVYKAEDLKLGRSVALKFLPEELVWEPAALRRFEREAKTASSLDHPNICTIYEVDEHEDQPFLVMQLLEGETLRDRLEALAAGGSLLPHGQLVNFAIRICEGLQAAHAKNIIHRDIKPANVFLTRAGQVKILDFGLAKLISAVKESESDRLQLAEGPLGQELHLIGLDDGNATRMGMALGTTGYMSPEQIRREKLDARTDLFSFGLVLYEMACGRRAFSGETAEIEHDAILHESPVPVRKLNRKLPHELERIINKALEKEREARYQSAAEMGADLKRLHRGADSAAPKLMRYNRPLLFGAALAIILLALGLGLRWFAGRRTVPAEILSERRITHNPTDNRLFGAAISPDGRYVAYTDSKGMHLSVIETGEIHDVPLPEELRAHLWPVTWFPDGEKLLFTTDSDAGGYTIWTTSVFGGVPHKLTNTSNWPGPVASPQGSSIAFQSGHGHEIWLMGADGEDAHKILTSENGMYAALAWSPSGQRLAYVKAGRGSAGGSIETVAINGGSPSVVISDPKLAHGDAPWLGWASDGQLVFVLIEAGAGPKGNLWKIMADPLTGQPSGGAAKITNWDGELPFEPTVSRDGKLTVVKLHIRDDVFVGELKDGGTRLALPARLTTSENRDYPSGWMHDSNTILVSSLRGGKSQLFRQAMDRDGAEPLTSGTDDEEGAQLSADGRWILYWSSARGDSAPATRRLMRFPASGGSSQQVMDARMAEGGNFECPVQPAGSCIFSSWESGQLIFYALDPIQGRGKELARTKLGPTTDLSWNVSPDGSRIAVASRHELREQVRILGIGGSAERNLTLPQGWRIFSLGWTADGSGVFASAAANSGYFLARIDLDESTHVLLNRSRNHWLDTPCASPDGRHLAFMQRTSESNAWLLENF